MMTCWYFDETKSVNIEGIEIELENQFSKQLQLIAEDCFERIRILKNQNWDTLEKEGGKVSNRKMFLDDIKRKELLYGPGKCFRITSKGLSDISLVLCRGQVILKCNDSDPLTKFNKARGLIENSLGQKMEE